MMKILKKMLFLLQERLPVHCRIYFIYTHKNGFDRFRNGLKANTEISYWSFTAIKKKFPSVQFLRYDGEKPERIAKIRPQDVVIGHIGATFAQASNYTRKLISFNPWAGNEDRSQEAFNCCPHDREMKLFDACSSVILLTSEYNKKHYLDQPRNFWYPYFHHLQKSKRVRIVHQPIDLQLFRRIKWDYQTNDFLYIGNDAHMKGVEDAVSLIQALKRNFTIYGCRGKKIDHLNAQQVGHLPDQADFFIQPGMWEAQCVSILEAAARGFIPVVSPETGYPYSHPFLLRYQDFDYNLKVLKELLGLSAAERKQLADRLYEQLVSDVHHNSWENLTNVLVEEVERLYSQTIEL